MKIFLTLVISSLAITSCGNRQLRQEIPASKTDPEQSTERFFTGINTFPVIKDTNLFIAELRQVFGFDDSKHMSGTKNEEITAYRKIKLYGSDEDYFLIEYDLKAGAMADFPWKYQLLLTADGKPLKILNGNRYDLVTIFPAKNNFLLIVKSTAKGNGGHEFYKVTADTLENVYEGYYDYALSTYDAYEDMAVFSPHELAVKFSDANKDGFNDIIFTGEKILLGKYTKDGLWYDVENGIPFSVKNPAGRVPIKYIFLYDQQSGHFKEKENIVSIN